MRYSTITLEVPQLKNGNTEVISRMVRARDQHHTDAYLAPPMHARSPNRLILSWTWIMIQAFVVPAFQNLDGHVRSKCYHLQNDDLNSLSDRVWRYHSFGYKIKKPSLYRFFKLNFKQTKFFFKRSFQDLFKFNFFYILINLIVLIKFFYFELKLLIKKNK